MGIMTYIRAKKASFNAQREKNLARRAQDAEVRQYKAEIEIAQREKIADAKKAESRAKELRRENSFIGRYMNTVKKNNTKNMGKPNLYTKNKSDQGYKGMNFGGVGEYKGPFNSTTTSSKKKVSKQWDPVGDYKGPFGGN